MAPQAVCSGVVTAWLQPQFLDLDVEAEVGLPTIPPPPAVPGPSPTPPPGDAIPQMALADLLEHEDVVGNLEVTRSPSLDMTGMAVVDTVDTASPSGPPPLEPAGPGGAHIAPSPPVSPVALVGCLSLRVHRHDCDPPRPDTPIVPTALAEGAAQDTPAAPDGSPVATAAYCFNVRGRDDGALIPAWLFDAETGHRTPDPPAAHCSGCRAYASGFITPAREHTG